MVTRPAASLAQDRESTPTEPAVLTTMPRHQMCLLLSAGNDNLHLMTSDKRQRLRVDLADFEGNTRYAEYDNFAVDSVQEKYKLASLGTYSGTAGKQRICFIVIYYMVLH